MHGIRTTPRQVATYMRERTAGRTQQQSADTAGVSLRTGITIEHHGISCQGPRTYRTRPDAFAKVWDHHVVPLLRTEKSLQAKVMFSAAFKNLSQQHDLTQHFLALCHHYGCDPTRNNRGQAHENG